MKILGESDEKGWEEFTDKNENIPPQYLINWKKWITKTYKNCEAQYFINNVYERTTTIFPFFLIKSKFFGDRLISQPFLDFGGPQGKFDKDFMLKTVNFLKERLNRGNLKHLEIRLNNFLPNYKEIEDFLIKEKFEKVSEKNQCILKLEKEEILWDNFNRITRKGIKKANKSDLILKEINNEREFRLFYKLYFKNMKNFGTPQHSYLFFSNMYKYLKENFKGLNCYKEGKLIASLIAFYSKDYMYAAYNFSESAYLKYQPNDLLYWEMIKLAIKKNIKYFDFGQCEANAKEGTRAAGIYRFKSKWTGDLYEKNYFYYRKQKKDSKDLGKDKKESLVKIWKSLPSPLIKLIGPKIASQLAL